MIFSGKKNVWRNRQCEYHRADKNVYGKQVARASQSCDQEFNVALRKKLSQNYRNIFPLISPKKLPILWNYRKIFALIFPIEAAVFCEIIDEIIAKLSHPFPH